MKQNPIVSKVEKEFSPQSPATNGINNNVSNTNTNSNTVPTYVPNGKSCKQSRLLFTCLLPWRNWYLQILRR